MLTRNNSSMLSSYIFAVVVILMAVGAVFVFSSSADVAKHLDLHRFWDLPAFRQILFFPLAIFVLCVASLFNYRRLSFEKGWLKSPVSYLLIISIILLIVVLLPAVGVEINYARRWLRVPAGPISISFQPSELAKWMLIFFLAAYGDKYADMLGSYRKRFVPVSLIIAAVVGLVVKEDVGTAAFIGLLSFLMLITAGFKFWHILTPLPFAVIAFVVVLCNSPGRMQRIYAFLCPEKWSDSAGYQANQSLIALGSGRILGKGLGRGICKYGHLPEDTTDFIFAIIGEELGFVGTFTVICMFIVFVWLGILVVIRCKDRFGQLLASAIVLTIGIQAAINIGVVCVVLPTKGIPLPFVSAGGTSLLLCAAAAGVLINIAKHTADAEIIQDQMIEVGCE